MQWNTGAKNYNPNKKEGFTGMKGLDPSVKKELNSEKSMRKISVLHKAQRKDFPHISVKNITKCIIPTKALF